MNNSRLVLLLASVALLLPAAAAMYSSKSAVQVLTPDNFKQVMEGDDVWLVEFYAPWCGHCKALKPAWEKAAKALKGVVNVAAVDADAHRSLGGRYGVQGFPTIKVFSGNKNKPKDYAGGRDEKSIVKEALKELRKTVNARLSGKSGGPAGGSAGSNKKRSSGGSGSSSGGSGSGGVGKAVVKLTSANFEELVLNSQDVWMVEFYAPWCGHCKKLAPEWAEAAAELDGVVKLGAVDATEEQGLASQYEVRGYPTIKVFAADKSSPQDYQGARTANDITTYALAKAEEGGGPGLLPQLTDDALWQSRCTGKRLCIIALLPHILDSGKDSRNGYIDMLKGVARSMRGAPFNYMWVEAGAQPKLEAATEQGVWYPAVIAVNSAKKRYATMRGSFSKDGVKDFLSSLSSGRTSTSPLQLPAIETTQPWDGEDGKLPVEEDY